MKKIKKIILFILGMALFIELITFPILIYLNNKCNELINMRKCCLWNLFAMLITYIIGMAFYHLTHTKKEKDENKNR